MRCSCSLCGRCKAEPAAVARAVERLNADLPHYQRVRAFHVHDEPLTPEDGLLTANGKLKRHAIHARFEAEIEGMYRS